MHELQKVTESQLPKDFNGEQLNWSEQELPTVDFELTH